jgi:hypothetical protein
MSKTHRFVYDSRAKARQQRKHIDNGLGVRHIQEKNATTAWEWCMPWSPLPRRCGTCFANVPHSYAVVKVLWPPKNLDNGVGVRHIREKNATTAWEWCMSWSPLPRRCGTFSEHVPHSQAVVKVFWDGKQEATSHNDKGPTMPGIAFAEAEWIFLMLIC